MTRRLLLATILAAFAASASSAAHAQPIAPQAATAPAAAFTPTHITVRAGGAGPDVILIPGLGSPREVWKEELPKILPHYRVHLVQVDGFAGSAAGANAGLKAGLLDDIVSDLAQYIEANHIQSPAIIGHSMGGFVALMLAEKHPNDVGKILVVDSLPYLSVNALNPTEARNNAHDLEVKMMEATKDQQLKGAIASAQALTTKKEDQNRVALWSANSDRGVFAEAMYEVATTDLRPQMSSITAPITVLWPYSPSENTGSNSEKAHAEGEKVYASEYAHAPHVKLVRIDDSRHFIMLDQPEAFDRAVQEFLKS